MPSPHLAVKSLLEGTRGTSQSREHGAGPRDGRSAGSHQGRSGDALGEQREGGRIVRRFVANPPPRPEGGPGLRRHPLEALAMGRHV
eukprot:12563587-Alexandrium_andersonii.AAC.1